MTTASLSVGGKQRQRAGGRVEERRKGELLLVKIDSFM